MELLWLVDVANRLILIKKIILRFKKIGGFHLLKLSDKKYVRIWCKRCALGLNYSIREFMGLDSKNVLVGSVGTFISKEGVFPGYME